MLGVWKLTILEEMIEKVIQCYPNFSYSDIIERNQFYRVQNVGQPVNWLILLVFFNVPHFVLTPFIYFLSLNINQ